MIIIKKIILFLLLLFSFNTLEVDSNSDKILFYDKSDLYLEDTFKVYLKDVNSIDLDNVLNDLNIRVLSYEIDNIKYYANDINELINKFVKDKPLEEKIYYENKGVFINSIVVNCTVNELIKLENLIEMF